MPLDSLDDTRYSPQPMTMAKTTAAELTSKDEPALAHDSSTNALIRRYRAQRKNGA